MNERTQIQPKTETPSFSPSPSLAPRTNLLQRKCACGGTPGIDGECAECRKTHLQRGSFARAEPVNEASPIVHEAVKSPGQPVEGSPPPLVESRFGHDFSRIRILPELEVSRLDDRFEQEANRVTDQLMRPQRQGATGLSSGDNAENLQRNPIGASITPLIQADSKDGETHVSDALRSRIMSNLGTGQALPGLSEQFMESRFGVDFGHVRVHTNSEAQQMNRTLNAQAFTVGPDIFMDSRHYPSNSIQGQWLLAHELVHVIQQGNLPGGRLRVMRKPDGLTDPARYPTAFERGQVLNILEPQQQAAAQTSGTVPLVTDPVGFANEMKARLNGHIDRVLPIARARESSAVSLGEPVIDALGDIVQPAVETFYGSYLAAAIHTPVEAQRLAGYRLREHLHLVPTTQSPETEQVVQDWVASRMRVEGPDILQRFNVLTGETARDEALFLQVRDAIIAERRADIVSIVLFVPGYEGGGEAYIQPKIAPQSSSEDQQQTLRRGRWKSLGTIIHEMLHAVKHERFEEVALPLEESGIAIEGFAEYFTRPVYNSMVNRAESDDQFRASIEGVSAPFNRLLVPDREGKDYQDYVDAVAQIRDILGGNEENLKVAYFMGRVEYLGLGGWNESEAARLRFPGNTLGFGALLTTTEGGFFRIDYARVILGPGGDFQFRLGGTITYLTQGERLGLGGTATLQYSGRDVYVRGGLGAGGSTSPTQPFSDSVRLDLIPGAEVGVRIGVVSIGAGVNLLIPVAGGPVSERVIRLGAGLGLSLDL